jgi:hypothetical protein
MAQKAARHTADVVPVYVADLAATPPVQITTWQDLIARYQEKFMPPAAGMYSHSEYNIAKQISSEDVRGWHARLRDLYNRAYPGKEVDHNLPLIEKLLPNSSTRRWSSSCLKGILQLLLQPSLLPRPPPT